MDDRLAALEQEVQALRQERDYYKSQADALAGESVKQDYTISTLKNALRQKRQGFTLLSELQQDIGSHQTLSDIFFKTVHGITGTLGMNKAVALLATEQSDTFRPDRWSGYEASQGLGEMRLQVPEEWRKLQQPLLVNKATAPFPITQEISAQFSLPFFVLVPIIISDEAFGLILAGRAVEQKPFAPPLDSGDVDTLQAIAALIAAFIHNRQFAALKEDNAMLRQLATTDKLTNIPNRRYFEEVLHQEWKRAIRRGAPLSVFLLDVDHFKKFNDAFGHDVGDEVLKQVAQRVTAGLRPGDMGARYGGEEFVVLLPDTGPEGAFAVAERVRRRIESTPICHGVSGEESRVSASIGVATVIPNDLLDMSQLISAADKALYSAKHAGRNQVKAAN